MKFIFNCYELTSDPRLLVPFDLPIHNHLIFWAKLPRPPWANVLQGRRQVLWFQICLPLGWGVNFMPDSDHGKPIVLFRIDGEDRKLDRSSMGRRFQDQVKWGLSVFTHLHIVPLTTTKAHFNLLVSCFSYQRKTILSGRVFFFRRVRMAQAINRSRWNICKL